MEKTTLDELVGWFIAGQDPLNLGADRMASEIDRACTEAATRQLVRRFDLRQDAETQILEDAVLSARERLWTILCKARAQGSKRLLKTNIGALLTTLARRAYADAIRQKRPDGYHLKCSLRYVLDQLSEKCGFVVEKAVSGTEPVCGLVGQTLDGPARSWDRDTFIGETLGVIPSEEVPLPELIRRLIIWHQRQMSRSELFSCLREILPDKEPDAAPLDTMELGPATALDSLDDLDDLQKALSWLWEELCRLPDDQCRSILLRMEPDGLEALAVEARRESIARKLGMSEEQLLDLIADLPLAYDGIGRMFGMSAKQACSRRLRGWERIERRYNRWKSSTILAYSLIEHWIAILERERQAEGAFPRLIRFSFSKQHIPHCVATDRAGNVYLSIHVDVREQVWKLSPFGEKTVLAELPGGGSIAGLVTDASGEIYAARRYQDPEPCNGIFRIDRQGNAVRLPGTEQIRFAIGLTYDPWGNLYVAEACSGGPRPRPFYQGGIWRITGDGRVELVVRDELLTGICPTLFGFPVGANEIAYYQGGMYITNTDKGIVVRMPIGPDGMAGELEVWKELEDIPAFGPVGSLPSMIKGLAFDVQGNAYISLPCRLAIVRINADDRTQETIAIYPNMPLDAPVGLAFGTGSRERRNLFVANNGQAAAHFPALSWPGPGLLKIPVGVPGLPPPGPFEGIAGGPGDC